MMIEKDVNGEQVEISETYIGYQANRVGYNEGPDGEGVGGDCFGYGMNVEEAINGLISREEERDLLFIDGEYVDL